MRSKPVSFLLAALAAAAIASCGQNGRAAPPDAGAQGRAFLAKNAKAEGVKTLADGLQYKIVSSGPAGGPHPRMGDDVKVNYEGTLVDGTVFDSSYKDGEPVVFTVGQVIPAWNEILQLMRPGDVWYIYVPSNLGYGPSGKGPIPPNSVMVFKIELLGVLPRSGGGGGDARA
jgi:peptidylprolyl isomerase/FKBP-type peptidyl-prolyl cis-trans isomerase FklB